MRVKVIKDFRDKNTLDIHKIGETIEISKRRYEEINSTAYGVFVEKIKQDKPKETTKK